jgi:ZIP family zinc transporter
MTGFIIGGIGTCIGGLLSIFIHNPSDKAISCLLSFAAGIMLSIISFDLLPKSYEVGGFFIVTLGLCCGFFIIFVTEEIIPSRRINKYVGKKQDYFKMGMIIMVSLSLHNFPEGVALGSSYVYSRSVGIKMGVLIAAHNIPEGMTVGVPLVMAGVSPVYILILTLITGLPTAFGVVLGEVLGNISNYFIGFCLSSAASSMLYVTANQLIPEASILHKGRIKSIFLLIGFICGCYLSFTT